MFDDQECHHDALDWTPEAAVQHALKVVQSGKPFEGTDHEVSKCFIILLDDESPHYSTRNINCGMKLSEIIALLEIVKARMMNTINTPVMGDEDE